MNQPYDLYMVYVTFKAQTLLYSSYYPVTAITCWRIISYVDGTSITSGNRYNHVWTSVMRLTNDASHPQYNYPRTCANHPEPDSPIYVGNHYYIIVIGDHITLWKGAGCEPESSCCYDAGMI